MPSPKADRPETEAEAPEITGSRSAVLDCGESLLRRLAGNVAHRPARDGPTLAPKRLEGVLALALTAAKGRRARVFRSSSGS